MTSIIIPAHNEARGLRRLLPLITAGDPASPDRQIIVVCNGCQDESASVASGFGPAVQVYEIAEASKAAALRLGNARAVGFPRVYLDSDVEIDATSIGLLENALATPGVLAAGPRRIIDRRGVSAPARWYYDVWELLPQCREGLFGRGVIAVSETGFAMIEALPAVLADDLAISEAFDRSQRTIEESASVVVYPARTWRALVRRRVRVQVGTRESQRMGLAASSTSISARTLSSLVRNRPSMTGKVALFAGTAVWVRARAAVHARRGSAPRWHRDETSRRDG